MPKNAENSPSVVTTNHFRLDDDKSYQRWKTHKLAQYPNDIEEVCVNIASPDSLSMQERGTLLGFLQKTNIAIYKCKGEPLSKHALRALARQLGLERLDNNLCADNDSITSLQVLQSGRQGAYIPYSDKPLSWHTDGYYNPLDQQIRAIVMHCVRPALEGGVNQYLDPEILYIMLRDENPEWVRVLMHPAAMTIPANIENGKLIRPATVGPVFSISADGFLHMRYSARTRNIEWQENEHIYEATKFISEYLASDAKYIFRYQLNANEGVICNNVLHNRSAFIENAQSTRLLYRARFFDRVVD